MKSLEHRFVERMPSSLDDGVLYISLEYGTILHKCACGCGLEVNTPLGRTDWALTYNGETISLWPSVGNWSFPCRSHYVIKHSEIHWAGDWSDEQIEKGRRADQAQKASQFRATSQKEAAAATKMPEPAVVPVKTRGFWQRVATWVRGD
jgi:hypothetical protein